MSPNDEWRDAVEIGAVQDEYLASIYVAALRYPWSFRWSCSYGVPGYSTFGHIVWHGSTTQFVVRDGASLYLAVVWGDDGSRTACKLDVVPLIGAAPSAAVLCAAVGHVRLAGDYRHTYIELPRDVAALYGLGDADLARWELVGSMSDCVVLDGRSSDLLVFAASAVGAPSC